jgi:hypothetical protein
MRTRIVFPVVFFLCLALVITNIAAAERTDRAADRTRAGARVASSDGDDPSAEFSDLTRRVARQLRSASASSDNTAAGLLSRAVRQEGSEAISTLIQILDLDLETSPENEKLLAEVYRRLGDLYEGTAAKQVHWYGLAMQYTPDPGVRARLEDKISELGGDPYAWTSVASNDSPSTREVGYDSCDDAAPITLDFSTTMSIIAPGDHDWFRFDLLAGSSNHEITIATLSPTPLFDDTDLTLWRGCSGGVPQEMLYHDDDGGPGYLSLIETGCLPFGTYYLEVGGWWDLVTPDNFTLNVTLGDTCYLPSPDGWEPDDTAEEASEIGLPTSLPLHANGWGRSRKEIQDHSIYPGGDVDFVEFRITGSERVRMGAAASFPTFFNDFTSSDPLDNPDYHLQLWYGETPNYGGYCNNPGAGFPDHCYNNEECEGLVVDPIPGYEDCISIWRMIIPIIPWPPNFTDVLAENDHPYSGGPYPSTDLFICLPRGDQNTPSASAAGDWLVRVAAYSHTDTFDYQLQVKNEVGCRFEVEPNNSFAAANPLAGNGNNEISASNNHHEVNGIYDFSASRLTQDADLFFFDVGEETALRFETDGHDSYDVDTALELYVGPNDYGDYFFTGLSNDDCFDWLSCLEVLLPPADDLLGNTVSDADYFINVTSWWFNLNFPYTMRAKVIEPWVPEEEPNETCETGTQIEPTGIARGGFVPYCDYDSWLLTLDEPSYVVLETDGAGDTTMMMLGGGGQYLACDDDSGPAWGSRIEGCLPAGEYCVKLRPYGYWGSFNYQLSSWATPGCAPTAPPAMIYDGLFRCDGAGYSSPQEEFETCPN